MKKLFVNKPLFRLLSPVLSGIIAYILILIINNNVSQLYDEFLGEELYIFIILSFACQEIIRLLIKLTNTYFEKHPIIAQITIQVICSLLVCVAIISVFMSVYYKVIIGYSINMYELVVFNSIFYAITLCFVILFISNQYLFRINTKKIALEESKKRNIELEFLKFKREINPTLFFDTLETLLILVEKDIENIDHFIDHLALLYRYVLNKKEKQLVSVTEELTICKDLISLLQKLPLRTITIKNNLSSDFHIVPGTFLDIFETISRTSLQSKTPLEINIKEQTDSCIICYLHNEKIRTSFTQKQLDIANKELSIYSNKNITLTENNYQKIITIPKLHLS